MDTRFIEARTRLGLGSLTNHIEGLRTFYRAWCANIPFDNILKTKTAFSAGLERFPFTEPAEFFSSWKANGAGATCWPHSKALWALAKSCGFDARLAAGSMFDMGLANHGTVIVHLPDDTQWLLDNAFLTVEPLRLDPVDPGYISQGAHYAEVEYDGDEIYVHGTHPPMAGIFFHLLEPDVPESFYQRQWDELAGLGPFNACLHIRKNVGDEVVSLRGRTLFRKSGSGLATEELDAGGIKRSLCDVFGIGPGLVDEWSASGALEASVSYEAHMPPLPARIPPSKLNS